jgi:hypothetical protein
MLDSMLQSHFGARALAGRKADRRFNLPQTRQVGNVRGAEFSTRQALPAGDISLRETSMKRFLQFVVVMSVLGAGFLAAQEQTQRGRVKSSDGKKGTVTITVDGKDVEFTIDKQTRLRDAENREISTFADKGLPAGATVMFRIERGGKENVLWGLRILGDARGGDDQKKRQAPATPQRVSLGIKPLTELGAGNYKGETGGLYGDGRNEPPEEHFEAARRESAKIGPLDANGKPAPDGKIVLVAIGMSNTTQEFSMFKNMADRDPQKSPQVVLVDAAQGGKASEQWLDPESGVGKQTWETAESRIKSAGVTNSQVQIVWIKQALIQQGRFGEFPKHAQKLESDLVQIIQLAKQRFPNLRVAYLSSRIYGGYATTQLNPEPYAFEGAFAVRWVIRQQIKGKASLNYDTSRGPVTAPVVLWGPYLWGDGTTPRQDDGLVWNRDDFRDDGTHPNDSGRKKVGEMLLRFFKTDPLAKGWFVKL